MKKRYWIYVWDRAESLCYVAEPHWCPSDNFICLGLVKDLTGQHHATGSPLGSQADLERACREQPWWNPDWPFPELGEDPIPF